MKRLVLVLLILACATPVISNVSTNDGPITQTWYPNTSCFGRMGLCYGFSE